MIDIYLLQKKLDGYKFPVYLTQFCPRNQTEWNERSSAINCTKDNGYLCFPNEKFTQLLEFCHSARFIWIQEGTHYLPQTIKMLNCNWLLVMFLVVVRYCGASMHV